MERKMQPPNNEFAAYVANIRRIQWVGVAERQLSPDVTQRIVGEWVHNPYDYSVANSGFYQSSRTRSTNK
jgi:hypothetical protein